MVMVQTWEWYRSSRFTLSKKAKMARFPVYIGFCLHGTQKQNHSFGLKNSCLLLSFLIRWWNIMTLLEEKPCHAFVLSFNGMHGASQPTPPETSTGWLKTQLLKSNKQTWYQWATHTHTHTHTHIHIVDLFEPSCGLSHVFLLLNVCVSLFISASLWQMAWARAEKTEGITVWKEVDRTSAQLQSTTMMRCIYFQCWDLVPHNMGLKGSRFQIVILLDFNKCYMVIFIKIDFFPLSLFVQFFFFFFLSSIKNMSPGKKMFLHFLF